LGTQAPNSYHSKAVEHCLGQKYLAGDQFKAMVSASAAAGAPAIGETNGAPASQPASPQADASTTSTNTFASLKVNGNNPVEWQANTLWQDNLGGLFTHAGQTERSPPPPSEVTAAGTTTVEYWAQVPGAEWLHTSRDVVVEGAANDNAPITPLSATGTDATTTAS
jgi:hypothetical protein